MAIHSVVPTYRVYRDDQADELLRTYYRLKSELMCVPGRNPRGVEGVLYAARCLKCGSKQWRSSWSRRKGYRVLCAGARCGIPWPMLQGWQQPGLIQWNRRAMALEGLLPKLASVERLLFARPRGCRLDYWHMCCWCWARHVWKRETAQRIAQVGRESWENPPRPWQWYTVRDAWQYARGVTSHRMTRALDETVSALGIEIEDYAT